MLLRSRARYARSSSWCITKSHRPYLRKPPPLESHRPTPLPLVIGGSLCGPPRSHCLSILEVCIPSVKPFILLLPKWLIISVLDESGPVLWFWVLHAKRPPREKLLPVSPSLEYCPHWGRNATMRARYGEMNEATEFQQAPYSWVINRRYGARARKADLKPRNLYEVPGGIEELRSFKGILGRPPLPDPRSPIVEICDAKKSDSAQ